MKVMKLLIPLILIMNLLMNLSAEARTQRQAHSLYSHLLDNTAALERVDFGPYMNNLERKIKNAWRPRRSVYSYKIVLTFKVNSKGKAFNIDVKSSSSNFILDRQAIIAVEKASPFGSLPEGSPSTVDIEFTFEYNVLKSPYSFRSTQRIN